MTREKFPKKKKIVRVSWKSRDELFSRREESRVSSQVDKSCHSRAEKHPLDFLAKGTLQNFVRAFP